MGAQDFQVMFAKESSFNAGTTVTDAFGYVSESIVETFGRTRSDVLRRGSAFPRQDAVTPYSMGAAGDIELPVLTSGFAFFLEHLLGTVGTTGPTDTAAYTHTGTEGDLVGTSLAVQVNRPGNPDGTDRVFTYGGGKIPEWTLANAVDGDLMLTLSLDLASVTTATALATAVYPTGVPFTWAGGVVSIGGTNVDLDDFSLKVSHGMNVDRRKIRGNTLKKEQKQGRRSGELAVKMDFEDLTQYNRVAASTQAGIMAEVIGTWTGPAFISGAAATYPSLTVTVQAQLDALTMNASSMDAIQQELSGIAVYDDTNDPVEIVVVSGDVTP